MGGWKQSPLPDTSGANATRQLLQKTHGLLLADRTSPGLPSLPTFAKCLAWNRRRSRSETPPGFPLKERSSACSKTVCRNSVPNLFASSTGQRHASGDCMETPFIWRVLRRWVTPSWVTPSPAITTRRRMLYKKFDSKPSKWCARIVRRGPPRTSATLARRQLGGLPPARPLRVKFLPMANSTEPCADPIGPSCDWPAEKMAHGKRCSSSTKRTPPAKTRPPRDRHETAEAQATNELTSWPMSSAFCILNVLVEHEPHSAIPSW